MVKEFKFPDVGEGIHEGKIVKWRVGEGESVKADQPIVEVETDKAIVELPSPVSGTILKINFHEGTDVKVGETLVTIAEAGDAAPSAAAAPPKTDMQKPPSSPSIIPSQPQTSSAPALPVMATPATRKLARELGVDIAKVRGSGPSGRIVDDDIRNANPGDRGKEAGKAMPPSALASDVRIQLSGLRKTIAERMTYSKAHIPHACGMDLFDVTDLVSLREKEKAPMQARGIKLTYLPFIIKACTIALRRYPSFNAHFDNDRNELVAKKDINMGLAVDTQDGLMVIVIKEADKKTIADIAKEIDALALLAKERKVKLDDVRGSTFTITNVGSVGGLLSTPIINPPEVAIMGIHRIRDMPWVVDGQIKIRKILGVSICFDHRVTDGALATEFMNLVKQHLEDPGLLLMDMI
jgi:pyruvate dehydrogenase E2 component (dihydrolipoamide acetyltransferase)